ncbi:MAG: hypothetical protein QM704_01950 [Anaeromyxobacteraceae bacterium]
MAPVLRALVAALVLLPVSAAAQAAATRAPRPSHLELQAPSVPVVPTERPADAAGDAAAAEAVSRRFDPTGEDGAIATAPVAARGPVVVIVFRPARIEGETRNAPPAQPVFVGLTVTAGK